jgi:hypothetical protein
VAKRAEAELTRTVSELRRCFSVRGPRSRSAASRMPGPVRLGHDRQAMRRKRERYSRGREAPIVVTPWAVARLIKQTVDLIRRRGWNRQ